MQSNEKNLVGYPFAKKEKTTPIPISTSMKLSLAIPLLLAATIQVNAFTFAQRITLEKKNAKLSTVLKDIQRQSGYNIFYSESLVANRNRVSVDLKNATVELALKYVLAEQKLDYKIVDKNIILSAARATAITQRQNPEPSRTNVVQQRSVSGTVMDAQGQALANVTVSEKGTTNGTATDANGRFELALVSSDPVLVLSILGYNTQEVRISGNRNVEVRLTESIQNMDEVVVVGYGQQKKVNLTGAVDQVGPEVFENRPITNIAQGLVGAVPNLNIQMLDGKPTQSPAFNVRGTTSIGQGGNALVLIDGVEGDPRMLNPNDIENISVLKDAASASIYGARAAFGVVLITTKSAKEGRTSITYNANMSWKSPTTVPDNITESYPWAQGFSDAWSRWNDSGSTPTAVNKTLPFSPAYLAEIKRRWEDPSLPRVEVNPTTGEYMYFYSTDWYRELYKNNFMAHDHNIAVSGGTDKVVYYLSGRYNGQDGLFRYNSDNYSMYNLRAKGAVNLTSWLKVDNNTEYSNMAYYQPINVGEGSGIWRNIADEGHPLAPLLNPDGTLSFSAAYTVGDHYIGRNGISSGHRFLKNRTGAVASFMDNRLNLRGDFTFQTTDIASQQNRVQVPYSRFEGVIGYTGTNTNDLEERRRTTAYLATNIYADYKVSIEDAHNFSFLLGYNYEQSRYSNLTARRNGIVYPDAQDINLALGQSIVTTGGLQKWAIAGGFFRMNYDFKERYLLEVNGRYDGSSKFPSDQQWAFFPSASAGWRISEEPFWKIAPAYVSNAKVRASYGLLGNGNIDPYTFMENFSISQSGRIIAGSRPQRTNQPNVVPAGLTWEKSATMNFGLEFSLFNNRLQFVGDYYKRFTTDMYTLGPTLPAVFGTAVPKGNYADLETRGWEINTTWKDNFRLKDKPFNYDIRFVLADYTAEITKYNNQDKLLTDYYVGQRIGEIWGYRVEGLFRSEEEIQNSASQTNIPNTNTRRNYPGDLKFKDLDGDGVIYQGLNQADNSGDKTIIGNSTSRYTFGVNLGGDWNGIFVSAFFQGVLKQGWYPSPESRFWGQYNRPYNAYPRWHENNMYREELGNFDAYLPRLVGYIAQGSGRALNVPNDRFLQDASFIRLRNLQVGYSLPQTVTSKIQASTVRLYMSAENIWTWSPMYKWTKDTDVTNIYGSDRDLSGGTSGDGYNYPMLKAVSFGLMVGF
ncbi:TonB-linked SusC/RagA family outer membrane protein [Sphingobacterium allocomposti]|uniref:TonB-linked SusC/RagA family outer membrane protein n=1 Tax=Sphingobacterium allocomposti TaxID=415956 RepID=A0A5S5DLQ3_9SPHI|nr:TonB-dependent receptor [Sphingobacterium composti Yoo et al. 2007 non Ten et al. 2007]TYP96574.1 TonB-linked SusC/RagA family outer membrane protein [Sphingobacterium composti Yoo et al. 2007 non Ten et al. 2007]